MLLSSHGQILSQPAFWMFMISLILILVHIILLIVTIVEWLSTCYWGGENRNLKYSKLMTIANNLGIENKTLPPQNKLNFFSWLVYQKKARDYYTPYVRTIGEIEGDTWEAKKKVKSDSIPRYFYGVLFSKPPLSDILATKDSADPFIMVANQTVTQGKAKIYNRVIHYRSKEFEFPKCEVDPAVELIDKISPNPDDINFISDKDFSKKFDLTGEDQAKIRALFNNDVRNIMVENPDWNWKFYNNSILIKYNIKRKTINEMNDIKSALGELSRLHNKLKTTDITTLPSKKEIRDDTPEEIIEKKLYYKRMTTFGCLLSCGTFLTLLGSFMLFGFVVRLDPVFLLQGFFLGLIGILLLRYGKSEWKRNKKLKADGKVKKTDATSSN